MNEQALNLKDIHLPEPISWWPLAPGWWIILGAILLLIAVTFVINKIYRSRQLKRDIRSELDIIKLEFKQSGNKSELAKSLSILLRRSNISYNPTLNIAGLTGNSWLTWLDDSLNNANDRLKFQSEIGKVLLSAPYLPESSELNFNAPDLILLCETWLLASHNDNRVANK